MSAFEHVATSLILKKKNKILSKAKKKEPKYEDINKEKKQELNVNSGTLPWL